MVQIITNNSGGGGGGNLDKYVANVPYEEWEGEERAIAGDDVYAKVSAMETEIGGKQDTISDLAAIRQGAAKGATAIQPNDNVSELSNDAGYINKDVNDLTNYTKTSDLPDFTTYQLKSNMVTSLNSADNDHYPTAKAVKDAISSAGGGDVSGPSSSVDGHLAVFDGATGKLIKDGGAVPTPTTVVDNLNSTSATSALSANQGRVLNNSISTINGKIPSAATTTNQLADKNYVDNSINSVAAYYITKNAAGDQFATYAELAAATTFYSGGVVRTPTRNDYTVVLDDENHDNATTRYSYQGNGWEYQYTINETALTQSQLDALNSGITAGKVSTYDGYASTIAGKQDALVSGTNIKTINNTSILGSGNIDTTYSNATQSAAGLMSASDKTKLDGIEAQAQKNSITGVKGDAESTYRTGNVNITPANIGITNKAAASGGTADTLVTTGDKYIWNNLVNNTAYGSGWNGDNTHAPSKDAVYDKISAMDTTIAGKQATLVSGTNIKTVNNESLLGTGNITISTPTYTAGDNIQISSSNVISATDTTYEAGTGIEFGTIQDYSSMRGPCPEGFHVPLITEWQGLETIMRGLSLTTGDGWRINLHIPFAGERSNSSSSVSQQGDGAFYWSSSPCGDEYPYNAWYIYLNSGNVLSDNFYYRSYGSSIRGFKDTYVAPDNTWTVIQGTLGSAGIFWNQSEGLISITNGTTGYTVMDKNLGATTVYNDGDTLTQANMGNMYQWGNNYGFPSTGTIANTSSTQVDASAYGPGNYYNSDTFITRSTPQFDWSSVTNNNLWGGETGIVTTNNIITNTGVLSVNGQTGDVTISGGDVMVSSQPNNILTSGMKIWAGTETNYTNLGTYDSNTLYLTVE